jgi:hypothetical protein
MNPSTKQRVIPNKVRNLLFPPDSRNARPINVSTRSRATQKLVIPNEVRNRGSVFGTGNHRREFEALHV